MNTVRSKVISKRCSTTLISKNHKPVSKNEKNKKHKVEAQKPKSILIIPITTMLFLLGFIYYRSRNTSIENNGPYHPALDMNKVLKDNAKVTMENIAKLWGFNMTEAEYHSLKIFNEIVHKIRIEPVVLDHLEISDSKLINDKIITILTELHKYIQQKYTSELLSKYILFLSEQRQEKNIFAEKSINIENLRSEYSYIVTELLNNKKEISSPSQLYERLPFLEQMHKRTIIDNYKQLGEIINRSMDVDALSKLSPAEVANKLTENIQRGKYTQLRDYANNDAPAVIKLEDAINKYLNLLWNYCISAQYDIVEYTLLKVVEDNSETLTFKDIDKYLKEPIPDEQRDKFTNIEDYKLAKLALIEENRVKLFKYNFKGEMEVTSSYPNFDEFL